MKVKIYRQIVKEALEAHEAFRSNICADATILKEREDKFIRHCKILFYGIYLENNLHEVNLDTIED